MTDKGMKKQDGILKDTTVLRLTPVKYSITLYYLGENYIERSEKKYRCKFELEQYLSGIGLSMEANPVGNCIENVVAGEGVDDDSRDAATPGKGLKNPSGDEVFRILVTDNHTLAESDANLLGNGRGDRISRPEYYKLRSRNWMKDVVPAAPFRIVVRKFQGPQGSEEQVDLDEKLKVYMEIKDPVEEFADHAGPDDGPVKNFQKDFFKKYNRTDADPDPGDDNILNHFKGYRKPSDSKTGVRPSNVIRRAEYVKPPTPNTVEPNKLKFNQLKSPKFASGQPEWAKFDLKNDTLQDGVKKIKVGVADFAFRPKPIGGDNYRFLLWLVDDTGKDVRKKKINGVNVTLVDKSDLVIPLPRAYCTGRFIIWRKVDIRLLLTANGLSAGDFSWDTVKAYYRHVFTEISEPAQTTALPAAGWRQSLIDVFNSGNRTGDYANDGNFTDVIYHNGLFPSFMLPPAAAKKTSTDVMNLCSDIMNKAVQALDPVENPPLTAKKRNIEKTGEGIYMLYTKDNSDNLLGCWLGNGRLLVAQHTGVYAPELNQTTTHEMAHGFFLRHANTNTQQVYDPSQPANHRWVDTSVTFHSSAGADQSIQLVDPGVNCFPEDHDQDYSFKCIMTYLEEEQFCGLCALTLRFADRIEIQKKNRFQDRIMRGFFEDTGDENNTARIVRLNDADPNNIILNETIPSIQKNHVIYLMAVGPLRQYTSAGSARHGRINLTCAHKKPDTLWKSSNTHIFTVKTWGGYCAEIKAKRAGNATVTFKRNGKSATANITVTN